MTAKRLRTGSRCPRCTKGKLVPIVYGLPLPGGDLLERSHRGEVILGGCVVSQIFDGLVTWGDPELGCSACEREFYRDGRAHDQMPTGR